MSSITVQGSDFKLTKDGCPSIFPPYYGCEDVEITFTPSKTGLRTGTVKIVASDESSPHIANLQGTGISDGEGSLSSTSLNFAAQNIGTQSPPQEVTLTNAGTGTLTLSGIAASAQFTETNTCGESLKAGANCTISISFAPSLQGILDGSLTVQDDGAGSPHTLTLSGVGQ